MARSIHSRRTLGVGVSPWGTLGDSQLPCAAFGLSVGCHVLALAVTILWGLLVPAAIVGTSFRPPVFVDLGVRILPSPPVAILPQPAPVLEAAKKSPLLKAPAPSVSLPRLAPVPDPPALTLPAMPARPSRPDATRPATVVRTGQWGGGTEAAKLKLGVREVQTGGFGDAGGLPLERAGTGRGNVAVLGSFDLPAHAGYGNGTGGSGGQRAIVASAGFGPGIASPGSVGTGDTGQPEVRLGGFDMKPAAGPVAPQRRPAEVSPLLPVEILSKPHPAYTEEARRLGVQGQVVLSVVFEASGKLRVLSVLRGLGHGLDEEAWRAAEQIRFQPAQRNGQPVDFPATLRVVFELAG